MFDPKIRRPSNAGVAGNAAPGRSMFRPTAPRGPMAGVRGAMARGAHAGACCPTGAGSRMTVLGPDAFGTIAAGQRVTLQFTPYCNVEGARFYLPPAVANLVDVASMRVIGCNALGSGDQVSGETFASSNSGDMGCPLTKIPCISNDNPLEVDLIGRAGIGEGTIIPYAALIGEDNRLVGKGQVQGAHTAGCCDDADPTRNTVAGSTTATLTAAAPTATLIVTPYCTMEGLRLFIPPAQAVNVVIEGLEVMGCDYRGGAGQLTGEVFMNAADPDYCFPLDQIKCISNNTPLRINVRRKTDAVPAEVDVRFTLFGKDSRDASR